MEKRKKVVKRYLISREGEPRYAGLTEQELDTLLKEGSVTCGDEMVEAREGDEIVEIQVVDKFELSREGDTCTLKPRDTDK